MKKAYSVVLLSLQFMLSHSNNGNVKLPRVKKFLPKTRNFSKYRPWAGNGANRKGNFEEDRTACTDTLQAPSGSQTRASVRLCPCSAPAQTLTCGRTTVLWVLGESDSPFNAIFLHLFNCFFCQRMDIPEANVVFVRCCQPEHRKRNCREKKNPRTLNNTSLISEVQNQTDWNCWNKIVDNFLATFLKPLSYKHIFLWPSIFSGNWVCCY